MQTRSTFRKIQSNDKNMNQRYCQLILDRINKGEKPRRREIFPAIGYLGYVKAKHASKGDILAQNGIQKVIDFMNKHVPVQNSPSNLENIIKQA